jgi:hypothetical protein
MFTDALYKAARLGYLPRRLAADSTDTARKCYRHIVDAILVQNSNGTLDSNGTLAVCSLNSTASYEVGYYGIHPALLWLIAMLVQYFAAFTVQQRSWHCIIYSCELGA